MVKAKEQISTREIAQKVSISKDSAHKILRADGRFPYSERTCQDINENNVPKRLEFCEDLRKNNGRILNKIANGEYWIVDETDISLNKPKNSKNNRTWAKSMPTDGRNLNPQKRGKKVSVFIAVSKWGIVYRFYTGTLDGPKYYSLLRYHIIPKIRSMTPATEHKKMGFLQDGAPCHHFLKVGKFLNGVFGKHCVARDYKDRFNEGVNWPPNSCDFNGPNSVNLRKFT